MGLYFYRVLIGHAEFEVACNVLGDAFETADGAKFRFDGALAVYAVDVEQFEKAVIKSISAKHKNAHEEHK